MKRLETLTHCDAAPTIPQELTDTRADPQALLAIHAFSKLQTPYDPLRTALIAIVDQGCVFHLEKVLSASSQKKIRPGNFTRMGPHTIATYLATAKQIHGPTFALLGTEETQLPGAERIALSFLSSSLVDFVCIVITRPTECTLHLFGRIYSYRPETLNFGDKILSLDGCVEREAISMAAGERERSHLGSKDVEKNSKFQDDRSIDKK